MTATAEPTTAEMGLLRAVLDNPADDAPRLVYADWLDENGEPERAEFVRVQCAKAKIEAEMGSDKYWDALTIQHRSCSGCSPWCRLRRREEDLWRAVGDSFDGHGLQSRMDWEKCGEESDVCIVSRGFVASVRLPLAVLCGGECGRCGGQGRYMEQTPEQRGTTRVMDRRCGGCGGTGRVGGIAERLFRSHPVTAVRLTDAVPLEVNGGAYWFGDDELPGCIPVAIFRWLRSPWQQTHVSQKAYFNAEEAHAYLSRAVVAWARGLAGLPPLDEKAPGC